MVTLYLARLVELSSDWLKLIDEERRERVLRCKDVETQKQILTAGLLLNKVFSLYGVEPETLQKDVQGKPVVEGLHFNLSHTGGLVACVVSDCPVGCDVEKIKQAPKGIAERFFHLNEKQYLERRIEDYEKQFFRLWTMKESYLKMTGEGLRVPMQDFEVRIESDMAILRNGEKQPCFLKEYHVPNYQISVCAQEEVFSDIIWIENEADK